MSPVITHFAPLRALGSFATASALLASVAQAHAHTAVDLGDFQAEYGSAYNSVAVGWYNSKRFYSMSSSVVTVTAGENRLSVDFDNDNPNLVVQAAAYNHVKLGAFVPVKLQSDRADPFVYQVDISILVSSSSTGGLIEGSISTITDTNGVSKIKDLPLSTVGGITSPTTLTLTTYLRPDQLQNGVVANFLIDSPIQPGGYSDMLVSLDKIEISTTAVPEPGTWATMLMGLGALGGMAARKRRQQQH